MHDERSACESQAVSVVVIMRPSVHAAPGEEDSLDLPSGREALQLVLAILLQRCTVKALRVKNR
jgi:hypothetical protein